jgi:serine phosphatase RsbU (regulator of sigma subunit)
VTEARNEEGDFFGEGGLKDMLPELEGLSATQAGENILENVDNFVGDARATDDLSLIILRRLA